ncbi:hypothetical protein CTAYLR_001839 [Chrysophaeum taylorii]|uniref:Nudix hydrolase domain-containing protein n=1 Tax=Chrysophaeum taylorii TaxID=2483200 RepID=A0AAD7U829_9STRA|nr:hypothetical protein CTAYLR_001839 [Chrysophaeum taylorii]
MLARCIASLVLTARRAVAWQQQRASWRVSWSSRRGPVRRATTLPSVKELPYEAVLVEVGDFGEEEEEFETKLEGLLTSWRDAGKLSAWVRVPLELLHLGGIAARHGFKAHHASGDEVMMYKWLASSREDAVPAYPCHQVGCAGLVVNDKKEILVVKEWRTEIKEGGRRVRAPSRQWKLPGGLADRGESFFECAARETYEETGVACEPRGLLALWHRHNVGPFDLSDVYCVVRLEAKSGCEIRVDATEISEARWYDMRAFAREQDHPLILKVLEEVYDDTHLRCESLDLGVRWPGRPRYATYFPRATRDVARLATGIVAVASDVDGTLLRSDSSLHPSNAAAMRELRDHRRTRFFVATGKCREGARASLEWKVVGGVFNNGLVVYDEEGRLISEATLDPIAAKAVVAFAKEAGLDVVGYSRDDLTCLTQTPRVLELATKYKEPNPRVVPELSSSNNKILLLGSEEAIGAARPRVEALVSSTAAVTVALPTMLEILPFGMSKREGVKRYCEHHGISEGTQLLAVGDGENDADMLRHAAVGVAVANAVPRAARAADVQLDLTNDQAGAAAAFRLALALSPYNSTE